MITDSKYKRELDQKVVIMYVGNKKSIEQMHRITRHFISEHKEFMESICHGYKEDVISNSQYNMILTKINHWTPKITGYLFGVPLYDRLESALPQEFLTVRENEVININQRFIETSLYEYRHMIHLQDFSGDIFGDYVIEKKNNQVNINGYESYQLQSFETESICLPAVIAIVYDEYKRSGYYTHFYYDDGRFNDDIEQFTKESIGTIFEKMFIDTGCKTNSFNRHDFEIKKK